jgi:hypothetical protein
MEKPAQALIIQGKNPGTDGPGFCFFWTDMHFQCFG